EMLTGKVPFSADTMLSALTQHVFEPPPGLKDVCPELPNLKHLEAVLGMLMAKSPDQRPDSCNHASELLLAALEKDRRAIDAGPRVRGRRKKTIEIGSNSVVIKVDEDDDDDLPDFDAPKAREPEIRHCDEVSIVRGDTGQVQPRTFGVSERYRRGKQPSVIVARDGVERFEKPTPPPQIRPAPPVQAPPESASAGNRGWIIGLSLVAAIIGAGLTVYLFQTFRQKSAPTPVGMVAPPVTGESTDPRSRPAAAPSIASVASVVRQVHERKQSFMFELESSALVERDMPKYG
ncbi:MAG: hypothetical protein ACPG4T_21320, partial [Nannocystaceae bacterium]